MFKAYRHCPKSCLSTSDPTIGLTGVEHQVSNQCYLMSCIYYACHQHEVSGCILDWGNVGARLPLIYGRLVHDKTETRASRKNGLQ